MPDIDLRQIRKTYPNGAAAIWPIDLTVADGECFVLLGPSGSGKTTLLRLIAGLEKPDAGTLEIGGIRAENLPPHRRGISFVAQRPALYPDRNVAENLAISLRFEQKNRKRRGRLPEAEIRRRVGEAAELLGLAAHLDRRVFELSGGEQHRLVLGRAIVARREIWLLDEPFGQLDTPLRDRLCRELHLLRRRLGNTIALVTHNPIEAMALADRVGVLGEGRLLQTGKPEEVLAQPSHRTVAFCFGWPAINWIEGRADAGNGFVGAAGCCRLPLKRPLANESRLTLGIRPEHLKLEPAGLSLGCGEVIGSQPLAGNFLTTVSWRGMSLTSLSPTRRTTGEVGLWIEPEKMLFFDGESGWRIE